MRLPLYAIFDPPEAIVLFGYFARLHEVAMAPVRIVWIIDKGSEVPRLVTAYRANL